MLVDIKSIIPEIKVDLIYATKDNFVGEIVYKFNKCLALEKTALALKKVQAELKEQGLELKIWDIYRPMAAQKRFWEILPDPRYIANPAEGGRHTRGTAVDLTIIDNKGNELLMPTPFDNFTEKAHSDCMDLPEEALKNRALLHTLMNKHGFDSLPTEWWHFDLKGWKEYPPLQIDPAL